MAIYHIPRGTMIQRIRINAAGEDVWEPIITSRPVWYDERDVVHQQATGHRYLIFRLPESAAPYTLIRVATISVRDWESYP